MCVTMTTQQAKFVVFCCWLIAYMAVIHTNWLCSVCEGVQVAQAECVRECTAAVYTLQYPLCLWCQWAMLTLALWLCSYWNNTVITELCTTYSTVLSYVLHTVLYWVMYYIQYSTELCTTYSTVLSYVLHTVQYWVMYYIQYSTELCTTYSTVLSYVLHTVQYWVMYYI